MDHVNITWVDTNMDHVFFNFLLARCGLSALIIFGSGLTLTAVFSYKRLRSSPNCIVLSLTTADLFGALLNPTLVGLHYLEGHELWRTCCLVEETMDLIASGGAIVSVALIAVDRYLHVVKYLNYQRIVTRNRLTVAILCAWLYVAVSASTIIYFGGELTDGRCTWTLFTPRRVYYYVMLPQVGAFFIVTLALYARIGHFVYKQRSEMLQHRKNNGQPVLSSKACRNSRTNTMISIVICSHFIAAFPAIFLTAVISADSSLPMVAAQQAAILVWYAVAAANPIIYVWRNPDFRWAFRKLLRVPENKDALDTDISSTKMTAATLTASTNNLAQSQKH